MTIQLTSPILIAGVDQPIGTSLTLGADLEAELVNRGAAVYTSRAATPGEDVEPAMVKRNPAGGSPSLFHDSRDYPLIRWRESGAPDAQIVDTIGTAATPIAFVTIPGGVMLPDSIIQIQHEYALTGNDGKTIALKATPASGAFADYAAATYAIGGQAGLTTSTAVGMITDIWNKGSLASQEATGYARPSPLGTTTSGTAFKLLNVDTSLDWNLWFYGQFAVANGVPSNTIRLKKYVITVIN